ncbi:chymotrypsin-C-like [Maniola jurtina]|uniref:chymotrypsin-C-like n=1 Tax=Maniola jurtina TaxID=191418 RepID=UPI001E686D54|nr:chymotrypsin-C-like [Maniola jurtina]
MKLTLLLTVFLITMQVKSESTWMPIVSPLLSTYPCKDDSDIVVWFEPGLQPKENNRYYVYVNKPFPQDCKIRMVYDSQVNTTFVVRTAGEEYSRMSLSEGDTFELHFFVPHQGLGFIIQGTEPGVTPYLLNFIVDGVEYCKQPTVGFLEKYASKTIEKQWSSCGIRVVEHKELIVDGSDTKPGDWPWHVAIYRLDRATRTNKYTCGGTLISNSFVLTAAHCATYRGAKLQREVLSVMLGKYTLVGDDEESVEKEVLEIIVHKDYSYQPLRHDIALLKLSTEVVFNDFIRPACLLRAEDRKKLNTEPKHGTIVGWGLDKNDSMSRSLKRATMPIVSEATCLKSNPFFYSQGLNDVYTFCAGNGDGTSACNGDSGGAFQVFIAEDEDMGSDTLGTWHVKGIISNTVARFESNICDPESYVIFTNVESYVDWIEQYLHG